MKKLLTGSAILWAITLLACTQGGAGGADLSLDGGNLAQPAEVPSAGRGVGDPTEFPHALLECEVVGVDENGEPIEKCHPRDFGDILHTDVVLPQQRMPENIDVGGPLDERTLPIEPLDDGIKVPVELLENSKDPLQFDAERFQAVGDRPVFDHIRLNITDDDESEEEEE